MANSNIYNNESEFVYTVYNEKYVIEFSKGMVDPMLISVAIHDRESFENGETSCLIDGIDCTITELSNTIEQTIKTIEEEQF